MITELEKLRAKETELRVQVLAAQAFRTALWNVFFSIPLFISFIPISAFGLMIGLGAAHDQWPAIPALGYWTTCAILWGLSTLFGTLRRGNRKDMTEAIDAATKKQNKEK